MALHGAVRGTVDIDVAIAWSEPSLRKAERALEGIGLVSRLPISATDLYRYRNEYVENRNLVAWSFYNPTNPVEQVDIVVTYELTGRRRKRIATADGPVHILSKQELIEMKRASGRPQDLEDVKALEAL